jgi:hypothetical protein
MTAPHLPRGVPLRAAFLTGCSWNAAGNTGCQPGGGARALPESLRETSGVAFSRARKGVLWSHNDGGHDPVLFALGRNGELLGTLALSGARNRDWEDLATGSCEQGSCIYVADTGDNQEVRERIVLYRIPDPGLPTGAPVTAHAFPMILPEGPRDVEALFLLPGEEVYLLSKGRSDRATLYRYPPPLRAEAVVTLQPVQGLSDGPLSLPAQITGADASPDGRTVVVRSYQGLRFFRVQDGRLSPVPGGQVDLRTLHEIQGEGVAMGPGGLIALSSEGGPGGGTASLRFLRCSPRTGG